MLLLGLETSCDETSAAVLGGRNELLSNIVASQLETHERFGGVVPELAARRHVELINPVIGRALKEAGIGFSDLNGVAATCGPALVGGLLVGVSAAKAIAYARNIPLLAVNHMEGHIAAAFLSHPRLEPPAVALTVSGGHTDLVFIPAPGRYELMGRTRDDAAGEAFDKVARVLGLGYPGGPAIDREARGGNPEAITFPRAYLDGGFDFSFSGLKTAVLNHWQACDGGACRDDRSDVAASFQQAVIDVLVDKLFAAAEAREADRVIVSGGVASNSELRAQLRARGDEEGISVYLPPPRLCTDNAAMIAAAGYNRFEEGDFAPLSLDVNPNLRLGERAY